MGYLQFDKTQLVNLEYSLGREIIRSNRAGSYASTTIVGCNTRKYHGLLVCPCMNDGEKYVLLSALDTTVIQHNQEFNLGIHKYQGDLYVPRGHKYVRDFEAETIAKMTYRVGGVVLTRVSLLVEKREQVILRYSLLDAHSPTYLRIKPFLAFRNMHSLSKANLYANTRYREVKNGIASRLYDGYPELFMQVSKKEAEFIPAPDWYYNIEYMEEQKRGYDFQEDLFVPGYFEFKIEKGESVFFSASTEEINPGGLKRAYSADLGKRIPRTSYLNCLLNSADQFLVKKDRGTEIIAGFPWFGTWGRDTFISLPGLTLATEKTQTARDVIDTMIGRMKGGLFPNMGEGDNPAFNSVDAPMWFIWSLQQYEKYDPETPIWKTYGKTVREVLNAYRKGTSFNIRMLDNGLIWAGEDGKSLTWMDAVTAHGPVTQRKGMPVEINALWYNAVMVSLKWAEQAKDKAFISEWKDLPGKIAASFIQTYTDQSRTWLADVVDGSFTDISIRPNQVIAAAMDYSPLDLNMKNNLLEVVRKQLLTPKGLRTLAPTDPRYKGIYEGDQETRDNAYHQGTAWPWLLEHFVKAWLEVHKNTGLSLAKQIYYGFEEDMTIHGIGSISEIYDGDPPHTPRGAVSQAWSVGSLLRIYEMIQQKEKELSNNK